MNPDMPISHGGRQNPNANQQLNADGPLPKNALGYKCSLLVYVRRLNSGCMERTLTSFTRNKVGDRLELSMQVPDDRDCGRGKQQRCPAG
jgi:hypothetical protein